MEEFGTYEYTVLQGKDKTVIVKKTLLVFIYVGFVLLWLAFGLITRLVPLMALIPVTLWMLIFFTWRYTNVEYEYSVTSGNITCAEIYGGRSRKKKYDGKIKDFSVISPYVTREEREKADAFKGKRIYLVPQSDLSEDNENRLADNDKQTYYAICENGNNSTIVFFQMTGRMLKICKFYNAQAFISGWNKTFH